MAQENRGILHDPTFRLQSERQQDRGVNLEVIITYLMTLKENVH